MERRGNSKGCRAKCACERAERVVAGGTEETTTPCLLYLHVVSLGGRLEAAERSGTCTIASGEVAALAREMW